MTKAGQWPAFCLCPTCLGHLRRSLRVVEHRTGQQLERRVVADSANLRGSHSGDVTHTCYSSACA